MVGVLTSNHNFHPWEISLAALLFLFIVRFFRGHRRSPRLPPGPKGWPVLGALALLGDKPHQTLAKMAMQYGPLMYLKMGTSDMVVASTPAMARAFLKNLDTDFSNRPPMKAGRVTYDSQDIVFGQYGQRWKLMKRLSSHYMLGAKALQGWTDVREQEIRLMVRDIHVASNRGLPVAVPDMLSCSLANIMSQMALSMRVFKPEEDPELSNRFKHIVEELLELAGLFNVGDFIPAVAFMDLQGIEGRMRRAHDKFDRFLDEMIERRTATAHDRVGKPDFLDMLMAGGCDGDYSSDQSLSPMNIKGLLLDLFIAGTDTASSTIVWALSELMLNPRILSRAREEMDRTIGRDRLLRESDLPNLPYLQAVCKETLRKHPSTPLIPRLAAKNCQVEGYDIPRGTRLTVNVWAIGRDPEAWEDPLVFLPERFLGGGKGSEIGPWGTDFELIPFGAGRRVCAGMRLGMVLVEYVVGTLVHAFKWRMLPVAAVEAAEVNMEERFGLTLQKAVPLSAITSPRLFPSAYEKS